MMILVSVWLVPVWLVVVPVRVPQNVMPRDVPASVWV